MSDGISFEIEGLEKALKAFKDFSAPAQRRLVSSPLNAGASLISKDAKARIKSTDLAVSKSIGVKAKSYPRGSTVVRIIGPRIYAKGFKDKFGGYVSTREAAIRANQREFGQARVVAHPFMRPAFRAKRDEALKKISAGVVVQVNKEIQKRKKR